MREREISSLSCGWTLTEWWGGIHIFFEHMIRLNYNIINFLFLGLMDDGDSGQDPATAQEQ
jgi:hypothetical protein